MDAFATVNELLATWPGKVMDADEETAAEALLLSATAYLTTLLTRRGIEIDAQDEAQAINLRTVCCNLVRRSMASPAGTDGVSSMSQTIGSTNASVQWSNPDGSFYLSRLDKTVLGLTASGGGRVIHHAVSDLTGGEPW